MPRTNVILNAFTGGEISPEVYGRTASDQWPTMLEAMENMFPNPRGGAQSRAGLHYVTPTKAPAQNSRLIPFVFSNNNSYVMEFGDFYVRFFRDNGYVEDIGNVVIYLGDGTTTSFIYPYPSVAETDIEVYDENGDLVPDTAMVTPHVAIDTNLNYAPAFSDAGWNVDLTSQGNPWTKNAAQATSAVDSLAELGFVASGIPIGGAFTGSVDIVSFSLTNTIESSTDATDQNVAVGGTQVLQHSVQNDSVGKTNTLNYSFELRDTSIQTSNFTWEVQFKGEIVANGSELAVDATGQVISGSVVIGDMYAADQITISVAGTGNHVNSVPIVSGTTTTTTLSVVFQTNPNAKLEWDLTPNGDTRTWTEIDPVVGTIPLGGGGEVSYYPSPQEWVFRAQPGLQVTLENPVFKVETDGYIIEFNTAPAVGTVRMIRDASAAVSAQDLFDAVDLDKQPDPAVTHSLNGMSMLQNIILRNQLAAVQPGDIFEIQSPFSADEIDDLYYAQANDVMIFCHHDHKPWRLTRYNPYDWRFEQPTFTGAPWEDGGYNPLNGYPRTVTFFQERLYFGGTWEKPQTLWGSRTADFYEFTVPDRDAQDYVYKPDDPVEYTIAAYTHEAIEWMSSERVLIIGTSATEHRLAPDQYVATDRPPLVSRMSAYGGQHSQPAYMGNLTVFIQNTGTEIRTYEQTQQSVVEKWNSLDLTWMAKHFALNGTKEISYALTPNSLLNAVMDDGTFKTMTYDPSQGDTAQVGWAAHPTDGKYHSHCTIPVGFGDQTWCIVDREINGVWQKYIEFFDPYVYTDSALTYPPADGAAYPPVQALAGLDHLEGKTVSVRADDGSHPDLTVTNGEIELNAEYDKVEVGLRYTKRLKLVYMAQASEPASLQGMKGRWVEVWLRMINSAVPLVDGVRPPERHPNTPMNNVEPLVNGDVKVYHLGFDREKQLEIIQDLPFPLFITAIYGAFEVDSGG